MSNLSGKGLAPYGVNNRSANRILSHQDGVKTSEPGIRNPTNISAGAMMFVLCMMRKPMPRSAAGI